MQEVCLYYVILRYYQCKTAVHQEAKLCFNKHGRHQAGNHLILTQLLLPMTEFVYCAVNNIMKAAEHSVFVSNDNTNRIVKIRRAIHSQDIMKDF